MRFRVTTPVERHRAMSWAQRLKRVFKLDLTSCENCGGQVRVLASPSRGDRRRAPWIPARSGRRWRGRTRFGRAALRRSTCAGQETGGEGKIHGPAVDGDDDGCRKSASVIRPGLSGRPRRAQGGGFVPPILVMVKAIRRVSEYPQGAGAHLPDAAIRRLDAPRRPRGYWLHVQASGHSRLVVAVPGPLRREGPGVSPFPKLSSTSTPGPILAAATMGFF